MRIVVTGETALTVSAENRRLAIEEPVGVSFGPLHMLAASLGTCTLGVLRSWAGVVGLPVGGLSVKVRWEYLEGPLRVGSYEVDIRWPELPESRRVRARRVAESCSVHRTLHEPPAVEVAFGE